MGVLLSMRAWQTHSELFIDIINWRPNLREDLRSMSRLFNVQPTQLHKCDAV